MNNARQGGAALVVSLVMLVLITLLVMAALALGSANFRAVSNTQFREEAIAVANYEIQNRVSAGFEAAAPITEKEVDFDEDGKTDYVVDVIPTCISATIASSADPSSVSLPGSMSAASTWNTVWDVETRVSDPRSGTQVEVHAGVRALLDETTVETACD